MSDFEPSRSSSSAVVEDPDPSFWALFKAQVRSDLAPFLALVPAPLQRHALRTAEELATRLRHMLIGAFGGFLSSAETALRKVSQISNRAADMVRKRRVQLAGNRNSPAVVSSRRSDSSSRVRDSPPDSYSTSESDDDEIIYL